MPQLSRKYQALKLTTKGELHVNDALTLEHPLTVNINGEAFTLTMQTPGHEQDLIRGLLFTEGIYKRRDGELTATVTITSEEGYISGINVSIPYGELDQSLINKRNLLSVASCGICGKTELLLPVKNGTKAGDAPSLKQIQRMYDVMEKSQNAFLDSGGCHGAAIFNKHEEMLVIREDIGRHNAVDKVIGALLRDGNLKEARYLLVSGRVSYEIITKCFAAGIPCLLAVSAPSSLAVDFARELGLMLFGFCRSDRATRYA